jgi:hypothetical protein
LGKKAIRPGGRPIPLRVGASARVKSVGRFCRELRFPFAIIVGLRRHSRTTEGIFSYEKSKLFFSFFFSLFNAILTGRNPANYKPRRLKVLRLSSGTGEGVSS